MSMISLKPNTIFALELYSQNTLSQSKMKILDENLTEEYRWIYTSRESITFIEYYE